MFWLLAINIALMSVGQLFFKKAALFVNARPEFNLLERYLYNPWFYLAVLFFASSTFIWVRILTELKISVAYPIVSISYIATAVGAYYLFGERMSWINYLGIFLIMGGVSLTALK